MSYPKPKFKVGEVAILQPPHPSAKAYWGMETTILHVVWTDITEDAMYGMSSGWCYATDVPAPPPSDLPEDQHNGWIWAEYDLKKKHQPGQDFESLMDSFMDHSITV